VVGTISLLIKVFSDSKLHYFYIVLENIKNILTLYLNSAVVGGSLEEFMWVYLVVGRLRHRHRLQGALGVAPYEDLSILQI